MHLLRWDDRNSSRLQATGSGSLPASRKSSDRSTCQDRALRARPEANVRRGSEAPRADDTVRAKRPHHRRGSSDGFRLRPLIWNEHLLTRKSELLARKSDLLASKSELLTSKSELLTRKSELLARKSEFLTRNWHFPI